MSLQSALAAGLCSLFLPATVLGFRDDVKPNDATLGARPPAGAVVLFDGTSIDGWVKLDAKTAANWPVADGIMTVGKGNIMTQKRFDNFQLHIEFNVPYMPKARGQARGNSGIFLAGIYELQVLDSYGLKLQNNDCGAIYHQVTPSVNACKPPLQWQTYDVTLHKAVVDGGKVVKKARVTVVQNGVATIDNAEIAVTAGGVNLPEGASGPIMLQDHGNPVEFRNIWLKPID
jgi:hypothetical protein